VLGGWHRVVADPDAVRIGAGARADGTGLTDLERLVDLAVAVVIQGVARAGGVFDLLVSRGVFADPPGLAHAHRLHARADAHRFADERTRHGIVVDHAVAIVVEAVADLDAAIRLLAGGLAPGDVRIAVVEAGQAGALAAD